MKNTQVFIGHTSLFLIQNAAVIPQSEYSWTGIFWWWYIQSHMDCVTVYKCLCDMTRLRILNLLSAEPLCVCHIQEALEEPQVKVSKHLAYLRRHGLIEKERKANWNIYHLTEDSAGLLTANMKCLQDLKTESRIFHQDLNRLQKIDTQAVCCD